MTGLMNGVKVVETGILMGVGFLGRLMADEGADVVKVERPGLGDYLRDIGPRFSEHHSAFHLMVNRNKRSLACDATTAEGKQIIHELVRQAAIFITGNIADTNRKLGLDYETLHALNRSLVYCQITGFGADGPYAEIPTHGRLMDALGGGAPPLALDQDGFAVPTGAAAEGSGGWVIGPLYGAFAALAALSRALLTGEGCYIDISCADAAVAARWQDVLPMLNPERIDPLGPKAEGASSKYQYYETKDGKFVLFAAIEQKFWVHWCEAAGRPDLIGNHRSDTVIDSAYGNEQLRLEIQSVFHSKTFAEWMSLASSHDIPIGPALRFDEIAGDPHLAHRHVVVDEQHPSEGTFRSLGNPIVVRGQEFTLRSAPEHGQHTDEVLEELGYKPDMRSRLRAARVIG